MYSCIKYAIINVIWATLNVIMCDTTSTRRATELKGDFDNSYLSKQSSVRSRRQGGWDLTGLCLLKVWPSLVFNWKVSSHISAVQFICHAGQTLSRYLVIDFYLTKSLFPRHCITAVQNFHVLLILATSSPDMPDSLEGKEKSTWQVTGRTICLSWSITG